ncbi:MAG: flagellar basal body L-ring protein FlgH [Hyphomonas sp.]|nr:flagellar basal body L-ring protein FlgH [Hyphomonas sp.]
MKEAGSAGQRLWHAGICTLALSVAAAVPAGSAAAEIVPRPHFYSLATDHKAREVGDIITIAVHQTAEARSAAQSGSSRDTEARAVYRAGSSGDRADVSFGGSYAGRGEIRRSGSVVALISARITDVQPNGDFVIEGDQLVLVNGEETRISVRGVARPYDIDSDNIIASSRLADARINYDGSGFVARSARPGLINRLFGLLGLGG